MEYLYVADTNLFFEGKRLEDLPWEELGVDPIVIALTKPVQAEIDKHKKGGGRTRKRALEMFSRVRVMLETKTTEVVIRQASPRVILRMMVGVLPDPAHSEVLDYVTADDRIVGIVAALSKTNNYASVSLMTDDGGAAMTASGLGLTFQLLDESWKREPVISEKDKQIEDLTKDLAAYRAQEPSITVENISPPEANAHVIRQVPTPLPALSIEAMMQHLEREHPMVEDFSAPETQLEADGTEISYIAPSDEDVSTYKERDYPNWITRCRTDFGNLQEGREEKETAVVVSFGLRNIGTRPASKLRISFEAVGNILLVRRTEDEDDGEKNEQEPRTSYPRITTLVPAPAAPSPRKVVKLPPKPQVLRTTGIATLASQVGTGTRTGNLGLRGVGSAFDEIIRAGSAFDSFRQTGILADLASGRSAFDDVLGLGSHHAMMHGLIDQPDIGVLSHMPERNLTNMLISRPFIPPRHNPEGFYFDEWRPDVPVKTGSLVCDLFRHQGSEETFEVEVLFPKDGTVRAAVLCRVQAENLTKPVEMRIPVSRTIEHFDLTNIAQKLVEGLQR